MASLPALRHTPRVVRFAVVVLGLFVATPARSGDFWKQAGTGAYTRQRSALIAEGDRHLAEVQKRMADVSFESPTPNIVQQAARNAVAAYERALALGEDVDIHYRAYFAARFIDDRKTGICASCRDGFEAVIRHAEAVLRLDPRSAHARELASQARLSLSKLGGLAGVGPEGDGYLERAIDMYDRWRTLVDDLSDQRHAAADRASSYGNSAELMMALGRLDDAIDWYRRAIEISPTQALHHFGLGVAYDRDGQWVKARAEMRTAFELSGRSLEILSQPNVFFVPLGDVYYYLALMHDILGNRDVAIDNYKRFITRSPRNRYQDRAREHLEELTKGAPRP